MAILKRCFMFQLTSSIFSRRSKQPLIFVKSFQTPFRYSPRLHCLISLPFSLLPSTAEPLLPLVRPFACEPYKMCRWFAYISETEPCLLEDVLITPHHSLAQQVHDHYLPKLIHHSESGDDAEEKEIAVRNLLFNTDGRYMV